MTSRCGLWLCRRRGDEFGLRRRIADGGAYRHLRSHLLGRGSRLLAVLQILEQSFTALITMRGVFRQRFYNEVAEQRMHLSIYLDRRHWCAFQNTSTQGVHLVRVKRLPLRHHFVENRSEAEQIRTGI